ncbi:MAG TPA: hypothetical protein VFG20_22915 [Planctomycetaceae bacterium]|jgi:uncharacterized DUF497 family protein|nr:hypothetical protein [Planctomycetaceae bacterium]
MPFYFVIWTPEATQHLEQHGVTQDEFEQVVFASRHSTIEQSASNPDNVTVVGTTDAGRELRCVWQELDDSTILPVTAYEPTDR